MVVSKLLSALLIGILVLVNYNLVVAKNILVIGGSGRVGGSAVRSLSNANIDNLQVSAGGRNINNWKNYAELKSISSNVGWKYVDINDLSNLNNFIMGYDLVINTAGPFQGVKHPNVLKACLENSINYLDVCDDINLSRIARGPDFQQLAQKNNVKAIISAGIWPGCSSLLAQKLIKSVGGHEKVDKVVFSFFTAGSGGAGPTILSATFLILGEEVLIYKNGNPIYKKSASDTFTTDFGPIIGFRDVSRLNLIECESCFSSGVKNVETYFGTAPLIWNKLFVLMANYIPSNILKDRNAMQLFAKISLPLVRLVDTLVGSNNAIRIDITTVNGEKKTAILSHEDMEKSVGDSLAAFAFEILKTESVVPAGVFFPEDIKNISFEDNILSKVASDSIYYSLDYH
eukprot:gene13195-17682_t